VTRRTYPAPPHEIEEDEGIPSCVAGKRAYADRPQSVPWISCAGCIFSLVITGPNKVGNRSLEDADYCAMANQVHNPRNRARNVVIQGVYADSEMRIHRAILLFSAQYHQYCGIMKKAAEQLVLLMNWCGTIPRKDRRWRAPSYNIWSLRKPCLIASALS
jgi:hypothetical protein